MQTTLVASESVWQMEPQMSFLMQDINLEDIYPNMILPNCHVTIGNLSIPDGFIYKG